MAANGQSAAPHRICLEAYGVRAVVAASSAELLEHLELILPPGWTPSSAAEDDKEFSVTAEDGAFYTVTAGDTALAGGAELEVAVGVLDAALRSHIGVNAPQNAFIHAGAVSHRGRAILVPGPSFSGKTTLVAALVGAGAQYFSDEYAVLDDHGLVHPYARRLSIRGGDGVTEHDIATLGGTAAEQPLPVGLVVMTLYRPGAQWAPRLLSAGEGVLSLLSNALAAQEHPERVLGPITRAVEGAVVLEGERGDASELAPRLLDDLPW